MRTHRAVACSLALATACTQPPDPTDPPLDRDLLALAGPPDASQLRPVERVPRARFGAVGAFPLGETDLDGFIFPGADADERRSVMAGLTFFTTPHTAAEGLGPIANQKMCLGCHLNSDEAIPGAGLVTTASHVARAARATPTNFAVTAQDPATGGGRAADSLDAVDGPGHTAAFTVFGDFTPATGSFDGLPAFSGFVQHTRPSVPACLPDPLLPVDQDPHLQGRDAAGLGPDGARRAVGERAGPPYIGRGLIEAVYSGDILAQEDPDDRLGDRSSLSRPVFGECTGDCISGRHNENTSSQAFVGGEAVPRVGRFGLRAAGPTILQFVVGGIQGELSFTTEFNLHELDHHLRPPGCDDPLPEPELSATEVLSCRQLIRMTAPPEVGDTLLALLRSPDLEAPRPRDSAAGQVQRGAHLFGIDLTAFANRMIDGRMPPGGDGRDPHAIDQDDRAVGCASCHTPIQATGGSPAAVGARHLSHVWAPLFSDLLLHEGPEVTPERLASTPRNPVAVARGGARTFDLSRNLADDALPNQGLANGREFRTAPLMAMGRVGPPFLHDARVYLSALSVDRAPAGTVYSDATVTNAPLVIRSLDEAVRAAIELHDLPAPDDARTPAGGGCPLPPGGAAGEIRYRGADDLCPAYDSPTSRRNRGEAREVIRRYRSLTPGDQQALIAFLEQL
jgi:CxxC motif-containing protein (DUF1111 family)